MECVVESDCFLFEDEVCCFGLVSDLLVEEEELVMYL